MQCDVIMRANVTSIQTWVSLILKMLQGNLSRVVL